MRAFVYLSQFRFDIRYRFDKRHVMSNALFKLSTNKFFLNSECILNLKNYHDDMKNFFVCDQCMIYYDNLINMSSSFRKQLIDDYAKKKS